MSEQSGLLVPVHRCASLLYSEMKTGVKQSPIYSVLQPVTATYALVNSFAHCVQLVFGGPHCSNRSLYDLKGAGLSCVTVDHAPNAGHS